jgi:hypothetical protein
MNKTERARQVTDSFRARHRVPRASFPRSDLAFAQAFSPTPIFEPQMEVHLGRLRFAASPSGSGAAVFFFLASFFWLDAWTY